MADAPNSNIIISTMPLHEQNCHCVDLCDCLLQTIAAAECYLVMAESSQYDALQGRALELEATKGEGWGVKKQGGHTAKGY